MKKVFCKGTTRIYYADNYDDLLVGMVKLVMLYDDRNRYYKKYKKAKDEAERKTFYQLYINTLISIKDIEDDLEREDIK